MQHSISHISYILIDFHFSWRYLWLSLNLVNDIFHVFMFVELFRELLLYYIRLNVSSLNTMHTCRNIPHAWFVYVFAKFSWLSPFMLYTHDMTLWLPSCILLCWTFEQWDGTSCASGKLSNNYVATVIRWTNCFTNDRTCGLVVSQRIHAIATHMTLSAEKLWTAPLL